MKDDVAGLVTSQAAMFPLSLLRCQESTATTIAGSQHETLNSTHNTTSSNGENCASTLRQVEERLRDKRNACGRPISVSDMTTTELQEEKTALQKALLYYESLHGRPTSREDRELARPLYDRYRMVKRSVVRSNSVSYLTFINFLTSERSKYFMYRD